MRRHSLQAIGALSIFAVVVGLMTETGALQTSKKADPPWPCFRGNKHNTGWLLQPLSVTKAAWVFEPPPSSNGSSAIFASPALGNEGVVYIGSTRFYALDIATRHIKWQINTGFSGTPAVGNDNWLYVGSDDHTFYAVDARTGEIRWKFTRNGRFVSSPALDTNGKVYVGCADASLYALNARSGMPQWSFLAQHAIESSPAIGANGLMYCQNWGTLYALNCKDGSKVWSYKVADDLYSNSTPALGEDGSLYAAFVLKGPTKDGKAKVVSLNAKTGKLRWEKDLPLYVFSSPAIGAGGLLYVGCGDGKLYALDTKTGNTQWIFATGARIQSSPAVGEDNTVYIGSYDKKVYALNGRTGAKKWESTTGGSIQSSPVVSSNGTVFVGALDGNFYAIHPGAKQLPAKISP